MILFSSLIAILQCFRCKIIEKKRDKSITSGKYKLFLHRGIYKIQNKDDIFSNIIARFLQNICSRVFE